MTEEIFYRDQLGRSMAIRDMNCLCDHAPHYDKKCPALGCGCLYFRTQEPPDVA